MLFGLAPAKVEHKDCAGDGNADACIYRITWDVTRPMDLSQGDAQSAALQSQLDAMTLRLQNMFATAADLIASNDLGMTLARITDRAALEVRAPKYLLAVRPAPEDDLLIHFKGCTEEQARAVANRALAEDAELLPPSWLVARVGSHRNDYPDNLRLLLDLRAGSAAIVPIRAREQFLGTLIVSVQNRPRRLAESASLADLLAGVAAHATSALENGILIDRITFQARRDSLTGLANRASFSERLANAADGADTLASPFSLFYLDLDLFKSVNDEIGDELLRQVAARLTACVRSDDLVARLGGDEFAVIIEGTNSQAVAATVERRFADAFAKPFELAGYKLDVGISIGRANWREHADEIDALVRHADT